MSNKKLKVLIIEDSEDDFKLLLRELNKSSYEIDYKLVTDAFGFEKALEQDWNIIISDYSLPGFTGFDALNLLNKIGIDIPFIIVSGTVGEDIAVEMMKAGAKDYIMKKNLKLLIPAIDREIEDSKIRREKKSDEESLKIWANIFNNAEWGVGVSSKDGKTLAIINPTFAKMHGYSVEELTGKPILSVYHKDYHKDLEKHIRIANETGHHIFESVHIRKDGSEFPVLMDITAVKDEKGDFQYRIANVQDITDRKLVEKALNESEERYRQLVNHSPISIVVHSEGRFVFVNNASVKLFGAKNKEDLIGKPIIDFVHPEFKESVINRVKEVISGENVPTLEEKFIQLNGNVIDVEVSAIPFVYQQRPAVQVVITDITERKKAIEALQKSEERFQLASLATNDIIYDWNLEFKTGWFSSSYKKLFGFDETIVHFDSWKKNIHPEDFEKSLLTTEDVIEDGKSWSIEYRLRRMDNSYAYVLDRGYVIRDRIGKPIRLIGSITDITERKNAEEALRKSEEKYRSIFENVQDVFYQTDKNGLVTEISPSVKKFAGYTCEEIIGKSADIFYQNLKDREIFLKEIQEKGIISDYELKLLKKDGSTMFSSVSAHLRFNSNNEPIGIEGSLRDISERKRFEDELKESEEKYRKLFELSPDTIFIQFEGNIEFINPAGIKMFKAKNINEIIGKNVLDFAHKDFKEIITERISILKNEFKDVPLKEEKYLCLDGSVIDVEVIASPYMYKGKRSALVVVRDISERKKSETALKESEEKYHKIFEESPFGIALANSNFYYTKANSKFCRMMGYSEKELASLTFKDLTYNEASPEDIKNINKLIKGEISVYRTEKKYLKKDKNILWGELNITVVRDSNGNFQYFLSMIEDITSRKLAEEAVEESEERYKILIETMKEGVILVDNDDVIQFLNKSCCDIYGYMPEELIGKIGYEKLVYEEDRHIILEKNVARLKSVSDSYEVRGLKKSGEIIWLNINGTPVKDKTGKIIGSVGIMIDITEKKRSEEEIIKISKAIIQSPVTIVITDTNGDIEYVNPKFTEITGYDPEEVIGRNPRILKSEDKSSYEYKELWDTIKSGKDWSGEFHNKKKNGELFWEKASISPVKNTVGKITHFLAVKEDVTEKKLKEIELINALEKAEESERLKSSFLANMSHEIRTPLNGILGFTELLKDEMDNPEHIEYTKTIERSGKRLLETLDLILNYSKLEAEKQDINYSNVKIENLITETIYSFDAMAKTKGLFLKTDIKTENLSAKSDERFLRHILNNLVNNAIKYTKEGGITLELSKINHNFVIKVKDTGIGIAKDKHDLIFEEFRQESEGYSRNFEGTGLGLAITKRFTELLKGKISVESEPGKGATFIVELPYEDSSTSLNIKLDINETESENYEHNLNSGKISILIVEDDEVNRNFIETILTDYKIESTIDGLTAIKRARKKTFDIILLDINLGKGMDGVAVAKEIRKIQKYQKTPIVALTAYVLNGDREEFLEAGCSHYLGKPFKKRQLLELIDNISKSLEH